MPNEKFKPPYAANENLSPKLVWYNFQIKLKVKGSCLKQEETAVFNLKNVVNLFIVYELDTRLTDINTDFTLNIFLFGAVKPTKNADPDKYKYRGYGIGFDSRSYYTLPNNTTRRNVIIFGADMS